MRRRSAAGDALKGTNGADTIRGGGGGDILRGMGGDDTLYSDSGNDFMSSADDGAADYVDCGDGYDTVKRGSDTNLDRFVGCEEFVN